MMRIIIIVLLALVSSCMAARRLGWAQKSSAPPPPAAGTIACSTKGNCSGLVLPYAGGYNVLSKGSFTNFTDGSTSTSVALYQPLMIATYGDNIYVADGAESTGIFVIYPNYTIYQYAGISFPGKTIPQINPPSQPAKNLSFTAAGMCIDPSDGTMYISDSNSKYVFKISATTGQLSIFAGTGSGSYNNETLVSPTSIGFIPGKCKVSLSGDVYFTVYKNVGLNEFWGIVKVSKTTGLLEKIYYCQKTEVGVMPRNHSSDLI
jgi:hypothetical protein